MNADATSANGVPRAADTARRRLLLQGAKQWAEGDYEAAAASAAELAAIDRSSRVPTSPDLVALCATLPGAFKRLPTGIRTIDEATDGGLRTSMLAIAGGAPGAHKTSLFARIVYGWARDGVDVEGRHHPVTVGIFATDEPRHGFLSRIGQIEGCERRCLDSEDLALAGPAWAHVAGCLAKVPNLIIFDPRFEHVTAEDVAEAVASKADGGRAVLLVDSLHSAPFRSDGSKHPDARQRIEARIKATVNLAVKHKLCVIATSELNRNAYRNQQAAELTNDMAAFKESSGIEYGADFAMVLRSVKGEKGVIEAAICKSRIGEVDIRLRLERGGQFAYQEVALPPESAAVDKQAEEEAKVAEAEERVLMALHRRRTIASRSDLADIVGGARGVVQKAISRLIHSERIGKRRGTKGRPGAYYVIGVDGAEAYDAQ